MDLIKYLEYLRKSSEGKDRQAQSIESQRDEVSDMVKRENLIVIDRIEESHSAKWQGKRAKFNEMLKRVEKGDANGIILWNISRLTRNIGDVGDVIDLMDRGLLEEVKTPTQVFRNTPNDKFMLTLLASQAKLENDNKSIDVKRGLKTKAKNGWRPNHLVAGYTTPPNQEKGKKTIVKDEYSFPILKSYFQKLLSGECSIAQLYFEANEKYEIINPSTKRVVSRSAFYELFKNPFYSGVFEFPQGSGEWYEGKHEIMISRTDFKKLQKILSKRPATNQTKVDNLPYKDSLLMCGECGYSVTGENKRRKLKDGSTKHHKIYHCSKKSKSHKCTQGSMPESDIENTVENLIEQIWLPPEFVEWAIDRAKMKLKEKSTLKTSRNDQIAKEIDRIDDRVSRLIDMRSNGEIESDLFLEKKDAHTKRKEILQEELDDLSTQPKSKIAELEKHLNFASSALAEFKEGGTTTKRKIIKNLGSNRYILDKKLVIEPKKELYAIQKSCKAMDLHFSRFEPNIPLNKRTFDALHIKSPSLLRE